MTIRRMGCHRPHRTGGKHNRGDIDILADAFQGKIAEFAFFKFLKLNDIPCPPPVVDVWGRGKWDKFDFMANEYWINVKSVKYFSQNLLLEVGDWDDDCRYIPNISSGHSKYDFFVLLRMKPSAKDLFKENDVFGPDGVDEAKVISVIKREKWRFDIPGYITCDQFRQVILARHILPQNAMLNGTTKIDADNYYVQAGDLSSADELVLKFKSKIV